MTEIDGLDIHFIHVRSKHENALPLIVTHGWPGSVIEQLKIIDPLTNPTAHGASASDAFHLVIPSMPGYGFSGKPTTTGWGPDRIARAWIVLMKRLGYTKFVAQGGDWGAGVCTAGRAGASGTARHSHQLPWHHSCRHRQGAPGRRSAAVRSLGRRKTRVRAASSYSRSDAPTMMGTRPQTLYGFADSPVGLATWLFDHVTVWPAGGGDDSAVLGRTVNGHPAGDLTRDDVLDDITLYWLTNTGVSSARLYWENQFSFFTPPTSPFRLP